MSVLGIVAEYDPFHNGHLHHLHKAMESVSPSSVLVALSGPFKQRGEAALLSPFARARCAVDCGADAVFALPVLWTVRDAEHYALGAVSMLASLGATHLAFGAETADLPLLQRTAALLEDSPVQLRNALHAVLAEGKGYPAALAEAAGACIPESRSLLGHANNILAVCYLRAIRRLGLSLSPVVIPRTGSYHAATVDSSVPSASAVRESLCRGDWRVLSALPEASSSVVRSAFLARETTEQSRLDTLLLDRLRSMKPEGNAVWVTVGASADILHLIVEKGSICIDGISLTVAYVDETVFKVSIIPHTGAETTLLGKKPGDIVNLENDIVGKYIEKLMQPYQTAGTGGAGGNPPSGSSGLTMEFLQEYGF